MVIILKINSKHLGIIFVLLGIVLVVSAVGAVNDDFKNEDFTMDVPSGSDFNEATTTDFNMGDIAMHMVIFENSADNSNDVSTIIYLKDFSKNKTVISDTINDLESQGKVEEDNGTFKVIKNNHVANSKVNKNVLDDVLNIFGGLFSNKDINVSSGGNSVSLSDKGLDISDADGENVSISSEGVHISSSSGNESANVQTSMNLNSINDDDYCVYLTNQNNDQLIVVAGNNLDVLKTMAKSASFKN